MGTPQICIIGAGISGLILGRCLLQRGVRAILFEKSRKSPNRNRYGITLDSLHYQPLLKLLNLEEITFRKQVAVDSYIGGTGRLGGDHDGTCFRANRAKFEGWLAEGLDIRYEHEFESLDRSSKPLSLRFKNGSQQEAATLIAADGVHSRVRQLISPETGFKVLPFAVYNGKRRVPQGQFNDELKQHFENSNTLECTVGDARLQISIDEYKENEVSISYTYSRPPRQGTDKLYRPDRPKQDAKEMPEAFFQEIDGLQMEEPYRTVFDSKTMRDDRLLNWLMRSLRVDRSSLDAAAADDIIFLGEAVHAEPILGGYGANEAIDDGLLLAELIEMRSDLHHFYTQRYDKWQQDIETSERALEKIHSNSKANL